VPKLITLDLIVIFIGTSRGANAECSLVIFHKALIKSYVVISLRIALINIMY
jgi:hypothetical protein